MAAEVLQVEQPGAVEPVPGAPSRSTAVATARSGAPLLEPDVGGLAERLAGAIGTEHPVWVFLVTILAGSAILLALAIAAGLLLTRVILHVGGVAAWDQSVSAWLARHRTPTLVDLSWVGSTLAGGLVIPALVGVLLLIFLISRHWRLAAFTLFVICVESGTYRAASLVVHRDRPAVHRLESLPVDASYPSGHSAAAVSLLGGLLLVLASRIQSLAVRLMLWTLAVAIPGFVIWSRLLRGMHHVTDVAAGALVGIGALLVTILAARASGAAAARRDGSTHSLEPQTTEGTPG